MRQRIWIPESFTHNAQEPEIHLGFGFGVSFGGWFIVDLIDAESGDIKEHYEFPNLITDLGLDEIAKGTKQNVLFAYLGVGTDATAPAVGDTALGAEIVRTNSNGGHSALSIDGGPITGSAGPLDTLYWFKRITRLFTESEANGNLTELGWFKDPTTGVMVVRSLFKDGGGTPIVITKTSAEQLRVVYEIRAYPHVGENPPLGNPNSKFSSGTVILGPTTHSWTASSLEVHSNTWGWNAGNGMLGATLGQFTAHAGPSGSLVHPTGTVGLFPGRVLATNDLDAYSVGTFQRDMLATWPTTSANFGPGGIAVFTIRAASTNVSNFQLVISESVPKTVAERLRVKFRVTVDRAVTS